MKPRNLFAALFAGTFLLKLWLASAVPVTGDEAYYFVYGSHPALGYYDHPPMVGWLIRLFLYLGRSPVVLRMPAILASSLAGPGIYLLLRRFNGDKAFTAASVYLLSPLNILFVVVTTDAPLYLFSFWSAFFLYEGLVRNRPSYYALSGALLGCAFLSKYFAVLLGVAYAAFFLLSEKERGRTRGFALLFAALAPFVVFNLWWNWTHSWTNVMFNLFTRNRGEHVEMRKVLLFLATQAYLVTPAVLAAAAKKRRGLVASVMESPLRLFGVLYLVPVAAFFAMSPVKNIGLHWALSFYPFLYTALFAIFSRNELGRLARKMGAFSLAHVVLVAALLAAPLSWWSRARFYDDVVFLVKGERIADRLRPYDPEYRLASTSFSMASMLSYHSGRYAFVFGRGSHNGRFDDLVTDFRKLDRANIAIFTKGETQPGEFAPYFDSVMVRPLAESGATFYLVLGRGFRYAGYRDGVLAPVRRDYYDIPRYLPTNRDVFGERYFPGEPLPAQRKS